MSRTRDLLPEALFKEVFEEILRQCINAGLVSGHTQVVDSAPVKANASMDSLELKVPKEDLDDHLARVRYQSAPDRAKHTPKRKAQQNKATEQQQSITATDRELKEITARNKNWQKSQDQRPGAQRENSKYTSNKTLLAAGLYSLLIKNPNFSSINFFETDSIIVFPLMSVAK
jgi:hypothetical protein